LSAKEKKELTFEQSLERLEEIVEKLEAGHVPLDESLKLFEEGIKLSRFCNAKLEEIERKIEVLTKGEGGELKSEPFVEGED
jgi:exodeoxyribonuclease VII small subunit